MSSQEIGQGLRAVLFTCSPARSFTEAMMKYDFKIGTARTNLMQLCFSNLASWPLVLILFAIKLDPFKGSWSLIDFFSFDNLLVLFLLDGRLFSMLIFFAVFFILQWLLKKEYILLALLFYFLNRAEIHIHLATVAVLAVYLSRVSSLFWLSFYCKSATKKIWKTICVLQILAWGFVALTSLSALDFIQIHFLFNEATELTRFNFLIIVILLYHGFSHLFLSLWGHFYFQKSSEPSDLPVHYSTAHWILRLRLSKSLRGLLKFQITSQLKKHGHSQKQYSELQQLNPGLANLLIGRVLAQEVNNLSVASQQIEKIQAVKNVLY